MSTPFLAGVFAMTLSVGALTMARSTSSISARHAVWKSRPLGQPTGGLKNVQKKSTSPYDVFQSIDPLAGLLYGEQERTVTLYTGFGQRSAKGRAALLVNTWDSAALAADGRGDFGGGAPHLGVLGRLALGAAVSELANLSSILNLTADGGDPEIAKKLGDAQKEIDQAEDDKKQAEEAQQQKIDDLKAEQEVARQKRDEHLAKKAEHEQERQGVNERINEIDEQLAEQNPPDAELIEEREGLVDRDAELDGMIDDEQQAANKEQDRIDELQKEIDLYEQYSDDGADAEGKLGENLSEDEIGDLEKDPYN